MIKSKCPVLYFRKSLAEENELKIASKYFPIVEQRTHILKHKNCDLVIPRFSSLPYYEELEKDINYFNINLINTYKQHQYIANLRNWYYDLADFTPRTWFYLDQIPDDGPFVLKGCTNSKKFNWNTLMFAKNKVEAIQTYIKLSQDSMIGVQDIVVREYVPLKKLCEGLNGLPISEEYRFFVVNGQIIGKGFYWANHWEELDNKPNVEDVPQQFIDKIIKIVGTKINGFVFDVAKTQNNDWILIELNDITMSGTSMIDLNVLYLNMFKVLTK